ncbi:hypothetical protein D3C71_1537570 [compost metagenome]
MSGHCRVRQFINLAGDQLLMFVRLLEHLCQGTKLNRRRGDGAQQRQCTGITEVFEQALHVLHLFLRVFFKECRGTFKAFIAAPGTHLQIQVGRVELQVQLLIQLFGHFRRQHNHSFILQVST